MRATLTLFVAAALTALSGCAEHTVPVAPPQRLTRAQENFNATWDSSLTVLRRYYFQTDRQDRRAGVITTIPQVGQNWTEWWRGDSVGPQRQLETTVQTILRTVEVDVRPTAQGADTYSVAVKVSMARTDRPDSQVTSASDAYNLFSTIGTDDIHQTTKRIYDVEAPSTVHDKYNVQLPRDTQLEAVLTAAIQAETARRRSFHQPFASSTPASAPAPRK